MITYKKLKVDKFEEIQKKLVPYFLNLVENDPTDIEGNKGNYITDEQLIKFKEDVPEVFECIREILGAEVPFMSYLYYTKKSGGPGVHKDGHDDLEVKLRLCWPILNGNSAATIFYKPLTQLTEKVLKDTYWYGANIQIPSEKDVIEIDRYLIDCPTIVNNRTLHSVELVSDKLPRIMLNFGLTNQEGIMEKYFVKT